VVLVVAVAVHSDAVGQGVEEVEARDVAVEQIGDQVTTLKPGAPSSSRSPGRTTLAPSVATASPSPASTADSSTVPVGVTRPTIYRYLAIYSPAPAPAERPT